MAYHISPLTYEKFEGKLYFFLERKKQWDINTLITEEDFALAREIEQSMLNGTDIPNLNQTIPNEYFYRQSRNGQPAHQSRFLVTFSKNPLHEHLQVFSKRRFQVSCTPIENYLGEGKCQMVIIAEERVDLHDATEWARKIDLRRYVSKMSPPVCFPLKLKLLETQEHIKEIDSEIIINHAILHGLNATKEHFGRFTHESKVYQVTTRLYNIEKNKEFQC